MIHSAVYNKAKTKDGYDFKPMLSELRPIVKEYDLAFYNQETILGGTEIGLSNYPRFNSPYEVGDAFLDLGFNIVSLSNNHTLDRGEEPINNSLKYWSEKDVIFNGSSIDEKGMLPEIKEIKGVKYTMLAYTTMTNGLKAKKPYHVKIYSKELASKEINHFKNKVDLLIVSMHWGPEYTKDKYPEQERISNELSEMGVDVVVGNHAHTVQPVEKKKDSFITYALGNIISAQEGIEPLSGVLIGLDFKYKKIDEKVIFKDLNKVKAYFIYTDRSDGFKVKLYKNLKSPQLKRQLSILENRLLKYYKNIVF